MYSYIYFKIEVTISLINISEICTIKKKKKQTIKNENKIQIIVKHC